MRLFLTSCALATLVAHPVHSFFVYQPPATTPWHGRLSSTALQDISGSSQLAQLASMTTLSIDSGDLTVIREYADTGFITDATTNPLFVSQAGLSGDPVYAAMVDDAVAYALEEEKNNSDESSIVSLAIDRLAVNLGKAISEIVPGKRISGRFRNGSVSSFLQAMNRLKHSFCAPHRLHIHRSRSAAFL